MKTYLIGTLCGGLMECPDFYFSGPFRLVKAINKRSAERKYNKIIDASFFYGKAMCTVGLFNILHGFNRHSSKSSCIDAYEVAKSYEVIK